MVKTETFGKEKYYSLDFLRGIAALMVALAHFSYGTIHTSVIVGGLFVGFFFILSGFVLSHAYKAQIQTGSYKFKDYFIARIARLYPLHILTFILVLIYWIGMNLGHKYGLPIDTTRALSFWMFFENITLTHFLFGGGALNGPSWSISIELWCSFYIFFLCFPIKRHWKIGTICLASLLLLLVEFNGGIIHGRDKWMFGFIEKDYAAGIGLFTIGWLIYGLKSFRSSSMAWLLTLIVFSLIIIPIKAFSELPWIEIVLIGSLTLVIHLQSQAQSSNKPLVWIMETFGDMSYGIYLWQAPIMLGITTIARIIEIKSGAHIMNTQIMNWLFIGLLLPTAWVSHKYFERPVQRWIKSRSKKSEPLRLEH